MGAGSVVKADAPEEEANNCWNELGLPGAVGTGAAAAGDPFAAGAVEMGLNSCWKELGSPGAHGFALTVGGAGAGGEDIRLLTDGIMNNTYACPRPKASGVKSS